MKFTFKRNSRNNPESVKYKERFLLERCNEAIFLLQHKCAQWLEQKTAHLSAKSWIVILFCFIVFTVGGNIYLIVDGLNGNSNKIERSLISRSTNAAAFDTKNKTFNTSLSKTELERMARFQMYMDSLGRSPTGKLIQDSILRSRPGLLDSLVIVENYYRSQFKNQ
ncbi:hypothetical protein [Flavobacterium sp. PL002]|uniref:hypothetical protein n=1 Tax=Flavobacterium sp. PL002 TaxID=1897058 RepID=UPI0017880B82|nr:hypothetical protein [Flavobacterium sp. PL002]MBE0393257.1 hypothetical protein [Flavobacterium sp. PL002]